MDMNSHVEKIVFTQQQISERVSEIGSQITGDFKSDKAAPVIVGIATGSLLFLADLVREIRLPVTLDFVRVESYGSGTVSNGQPTISTGLKIDITGKHVILVEDIVDTGHTLSCLIDYMKTKGASSISICTLLDKPAGRKVNFEPFGEGKFYSGFECPDYFVVGYGLDYAEVYRNLPYVCILKPQIFNSQN